MRRLATVRWFVALIRDQRETEVSMARLNYDFARREKERIRKARQQEKLERRTGRDSASPADSQPIDAPATNPEAGQSEAAQKGAALPPESGK